VCLSVGTAWLLASHRGACLTPFCERASCLAVTGLHGSPIPLMPAVLWPLSRGTPPSPSHAARSQMKRIVVWTSVLYAGYVDGATIHVTGPDERQVEFGDGTTSFATLSGGEGFLNSTVNGECP